MTDKPKDGPMNAPAAKVIECPCGVVLRGDTDEETISNAQRHAQENHEMELSRDQALSMARPA